MRIILGMALVALLCGCGPRTRGDAARVAWDTGQAEDCKVYLYEDYVEIYQQYEDPMVIPRERLKELVWQGPLWERMREYQESKGKTNR